MLFIDLIYRNFGWSLWQLHRITKCNIAGVPSTWMIWHCSKSLLQLNIVNRAISAKLLPVFLTSSHPSNSRMGNVQRAQKTECRKIACPDGLPGKLIKEFACELSAPVADILNDLFMQVMFHEFWRMLLLLLFLKKCLQQLQNSDQSP